MKIRHPLAIRVVAFLAAIVIRVWMGFSSLRYRPKGRSCNPRDGLDRPYIFVFYHEHILGPPVFTSHRKVSVLISQHADGEIIAQAIEHLGFSTVRGSTTRGGTEALRAMMRLARKGHSVSVIPDGPRGPRRKVEAGLPYLASKTGMPIILMGVAFVDCWRLNTWDKFAVPKFGTDTILLTSEAIEVPKNLKRDQVEEWRVRLETEMQLINEEAEREATRLRERRSGWFWWLRSKRG